MYMLVHLLCPLRRMDGGQVEDIIDACRKEFPERDCYGARVGCLRNMLGKRLHGEGSKRLIARPF
mgnify:CR=1 FL=1